MDDRDEMVVSSAIQTLVALSEMDRRATAALEAAREKLKGAAAEELAEALAHESSRLE